MASSDDEGETVPDAVSNYHFVNDKDEPISLSELPVQWNEGEGLDGKRKQIFLRGTADNGLQKIYKQVTKWKFDISAAQPLISVLSKENNWIKLQKPRKSFEEMIRTTLITVQCLHLVKKNPEMSGRSLWDHLAKVFSLYETKPSENDLIDHMSLISEAVKVDKTLAKSKFLLRFLEEKPPKKEFDENIGTTTDDRFIVDDDMIDEIEEDDGSDEEDDLYDSVCSICDNGGDILCCEGRCMRSFHATEEAGSESMCDSLGLSNEQVEAMQNFLCKNCQYKKHQCFSCGVLGSSDKLSGAEVFPCVSATCGRFYHPHCVAKLLHPESAADAEVLHKKISAGDAFTCPIHKCIICKQGENKMDPDLQFAVCRRCPKSYHRKCLPREIAFEDLEEEDIIQRAWEDLIPNRILIYCLKHEIDDEIGTPIRNHLKFPGDGKKKKTQESVQLTSKGKVLRKESTLAAPDAPRKRTLGKVQRGANLSLTPKEADLSKKNMRRSTGLDSSKKRKLGDISRKPLDSSTSRKVCKSTIEENGPSLGEKLYYVSKGSESFKSRKDDRSGHKQILVDKPVAKEISKELPLGDDSKKRILALVKEAASSVTMDSLKNVIDKTITLGKVEGSVEALRAALQKLEGGGSIEDAKAVCEPQLLNQMVKWKRKLKVYLAPFLHGKRYTSYGRHFTKVNKLKEIVDRLHCYVQDGDMIVDFCCGANDFSLLMKKKLDETGRNCSYKNYDLLPAKNDFNFEKKNWFEVKREDLSTGSQLIMGLNPPFGVNASLANKFINRALEFKPKLLILIVPKETERLDKKKSPYDLVWEDDELLAGKSFYLPGSVDINDNQLDDWNKETPPLYLWSRPDWTETHKAIAQKHGHVTRLEERPYLEDPHETLVPDSPMEVHDLNGQTSKSVDDHPIENVYEQLQERGAGVPESQKVVNCDNVEREVKVDCRLGKNNSDGDSKKKRHHGKGKHGRGSGDKSQECKEKEQRSLREVQDRIRCSSPTNFARGRSPGGHSSKVLGASTHVVVGEEDQHHVQHNVAPLCSQYQTSYDETRADDIARRYGLNNNEPYSGTTHRWSSGTSPSLGPDYGLRNSEGQFTGYQRESTDGRGYRSYLGDMEEKYPREPAVRSQVPLHGQQYHEPLSQRSSYSAGGDPGFSSSYSHRGPAGDSSYKAMNTSSTMQRYAPRLDELNHTRMNTFGPEPPATASRNGGPDPLARQPGYRVDSLGFAPAPYRPFSPHNSSGWLHE